MRRPLQIAAGLGLAWIALLAAARVSADSLPPPRAKPIVPAPVWPTKPGPPALPGATLAEPPEPVASYTLSASLDPSKHEISGKGTIVFRNASPYPTSEVWIHLYLNGFKNDRTVWARFPGSGSFRGVGAALSDWGWIRVKRLALHGGADLWPDADKTSPGDPDDETDIRVPLPAPIAPGERVTFDVEWVSHLPSPGFRTGWYQSFHLAGQWFPKLARFDEKTGRWAHFPFHHLSEFYADFGTYDVTIDTPEDMIVGATGRMEGEVRTSGRVARRFVQEGVHDFAFTAWDQFRELTALTADGVAIRVLYPKGHDEVAKVELDTVRYGLSFFGDAFGRYPYPTLTVVHPPEGAGDTGGMEYPTLITTGGHWFDAWTATRLLETVTIHELGHQWFYGLVATDEHGSPFLDEGLNSYAETIALENRFPNASATEAGGLRLGWAALHRTGAIEVAKNAPIAQPADAFVNGSDYATLVYSRTATILNTFARVYGDAEVKRAIGLYTRRYRFQHPGPVELLDTVREALGEDTAKQLARALFERGTVDYSVSEVQSYADGPARGVFGDPSAPRAAPAGGEGYRGHVLVRRRGSLRFPVDVDMIAKDGSVTRVRWDADESAAYLPYHGASKLVAAVIDPDHRVLLDEDLSNNAKSASSKRISGALVDRLWVGVEAALSGVLP